MAIVGPELGRGVAVGGDGLVRALRPDEAAVVEAIQRGGPDAHDRASSYRSVPLGGGVRVVRAVEAGGVRPGAAAVAPAHMRLLDAYASIGGLVLASAVPGVGDPEAVAEALVRSWIRQVGGVGVLLSGAPGVELVDGAAAVVRIPPDAATALHAVAAGARAAAAPMDGPAAAEAAVRFALSGLPCAVHGAAASPEAGVQLLSRLAGGDATVGAVLAAVLHASHAGSALVETHTAEARRLISEGRAHLLFTDVERSPAGA
jgi:hypothetical protein